MSIIPELRRLRQENSKFEDSLGYISEFEASLTYITRPCHKRKKERQREREKEGKKE
jgi:hypothetical protein